MNEYTVNGKTYDLLIQDGDIILQSEAQDLVYDKGFEKCKDQAREYCKQNAFDDNGRWLGYSERHVDDIAMDFIRDFVKSEPYTVVVNN
jgi:hypothetical protein